MSATKARQAQCPQCWVRTGPPCTVSGPDGDHLARYIAAESAGLIAREELKAVIAPLVVIAPHVIVLEDAALVTLCPSRHDTAGNPPASLEAS